MNLGVLGATGVVGEEVLAILAARSFPIDELRVFASERSVGRKINTPVGEVACILPTAAAFAGLDLIIVDVEDDLAREWIPVAEAAGAVVIDNSAAFRMEPGVPLVVAEVNPKDVGARKRNIVSCPNCTTMVLITALAPLHRITPITRMVVSTYQAVSGAGRAGIAELARQWEAGVGREVDLGQAGKHPELITSGQVWDRPIAGNVIPRAGSLASDGTTSEEAKLLHESRKILHAPELRVAATCVRVPVYVGHSMSVNVEFSGPLSAAAAVSALSSAPGVLVSDNGTGAPTALEGAGIDPVLVGRVRDDLSQANTLNLWVTGDNLRKGAALNAVQLAEIVVAE